jgi:hypothetical protein
MKLYIFIDYLEHLSSCQMVTDNGSLLNHALGCLKNLIKLTIKIDGFLNLLILYLLFRWFPQWVVEVLSSQSLLEFTKLESLNWEIYK